MRQFQEAYPNPPRAELRRIAGSGEVWVIEGTSEYPQGGSFHVADIIEFRDDKILKETRYYAEPFRGTCLARGVGRKNVVANGQA